jgi:uncharacterized protein with LGFP repeats
MLVAVLVVGSPLAPPANAKPEAADPVRGRSVALDARAFAAQGQRFPHTRPFEMVAVTWKAGAGGSIEIRTRTDGAWSPWIDLPTLEDGPDRGSWESGTGAPHGTQPLWVGPSDGVQVRAEEAGRRGLRLVLIDPGTRLSDREPDQVVGGTYLSRQSSPTGQVSRPKIHARRAWGANESWRDGGPYYNKTLRQAHIHHTASSNRYTKEDVPAIIRGLYYYHTKQLGWSDLGYNFVVDKFGRTWEGRAGGIRRVVMGAHTRGFNHRSFGVAVLGTHTGRRPNADIMRALVRITSWKLDLYGRRPAGTVLMKSHGSDLYRRGTVVRLPVIDGHRDTNQTACPGWEIYERLPAIRNRAQRRVNAF